MEILRASFVFLGKGLLQTPEERERFIGHVGAEVLQAELSGVPMQISGQPRGLITGQASSTTLQIDRERVTVNLAAERSAFEKAYPVPPADFDRLGTLVCLAVKYTKSWSQPAAVGYNIELVHDWKSGTAFRLLSERLLRPDLPIPSEWQHRGVATCNILFDGEDRNTRWQFQFEPRLGDVNASKLFAAVNLHIDHPTTQFTEDEVSSRLHHAWKQGSAFVESL